MPTTPTATREAPDPRVELLVQFSELVHASFAGDAIRANSARDRLRRSGVVVEFLPAAATRRGDRRR